jgi:hypothetical protein
MGEAAAQVQTVVSRLLHEVEREEDEVTRKVKREAEE